MVVLSEALIPGNEYTLVLQIDDIPENLAQSQAEVRVEINPDYYMLFLELEVVGAVFVLAALCSAVLAVRWSRGSAGNEGSVRGQS